jgi:spore coat polysaccharide biosynthesis protein SpsF
MEKKRYGVIIAARMGSHRLPGKALLPLNRTPMIVFLLKRLKQSKKINRFIFATTTLKEDNLLVEKVKEENVDIFRGQCEDVVNRYVSAADQHDLDYVVRVTGDCPLVDGDSLDYCIELCEELYGYDLATTKGYFPVGIDFEVYKSKSMKVLEKSELTKDEREHVTLAFYNRQEQFNISQLHPPEHWPFITKHLTVDTKDDYNFICSIVDREESNFITIPMILNKVNALL